MIKPRAVAALRLISDDRHPYLLRARRQQRRGNGAAEQRDELASSQVEHGSPPEPAMPAYSRPRMQRKRPQVLGMDLNRSEIAG
jgi:hypothetical protein